MEGILGRVSDAPLRDGNSIQLLKNGPDTYDDWLTAIGRAERWIHLDNYIIANDEIGTRFAEALSAKAKEGVRVRVLHDWFGCMNVPRSFWRGMREAGVQVKAVNPPASGQPLGVIRRDHRKLLAIDGEYASTGGVCIADGWMVRSEETGLPYRDTAVSVGAPSSPTSTVPSAACGASWWKSCPRRSALELGHPAGGRDVRASGHPGTEKDAHAQMLELLTAGYRSALDNDPYFLPTLTQSPEATARDGVGCKVLKSPATGHSSDRQGPRAGYRQFLESGVRISSTADP